MVALLVSVCCGKTQEWLGIKPPTLGYVDRCSALLKLDTVLWYFTIAPVNLILYTTQYLVAVALTGWSRFFASSPQTSAPPAPSALLFDPRKRAETNLNFAVILPNHQVLSIFHIHIGAVAYVWANSTKPSWTCTAEVLREIFSFLVFLLLYLYSVSLRS